MSARANDALVDELVAGGMLRSEAVAKAFRSVDRAAFVPAELRPEAYGDYPLPIGFGQTISQPTTVAFMLELLSLQAGERVLEVGCGCGYVLALMSYVVGRSGHVFGIERIPELANIASANVKRLGLSNVEISAGDGAQGLAERAPYDAILVSAAAREVPHKLLEQLAGAGRLVAPVGQYTQDIVVVKRKNRGFIEQRYPGFRFVPLISKGN